MQDAAESIFREAVALHRQGRIADAEARYRALLAHAPRHFDALNLLGAICLHRGDATQAADLFATALAAQPDSPAAHSNRGIALRNLGRPKEALTHFERALALKPDYPIGLNNRGLALQDLGEHEQAIASFDQATALAPDYGEPAAHRQRSVEALLAKYDALLAAEPNLPEAHYNRGFVLQDQGRFDEALAAYDHALSGRPTWAQVHYTRGLALQALGRHEDALASYLRAMAEDPDHAAAHVSVAHCALLLGKFSQGWREYEWRLHGKTARFSGAAWSGSETLEGKTLLLHAEQGIGDTIQFARYARQAAMLGARVILEVQPPLKDLMQGLAGTDAVVAAGEPLTAFDLHCPLLSLPLALRTDAAHIPAEQAYITPDPAIVARWKTRLGSATRRRVGIAWSGRPDHANDRNRSIALETFAGLLSTRAEFISLQKDERLRDQKHLAELKQLRHFGADLNDFAETAGLIANLDLVISVDTSVAHLATAMGKPTWILLPFVPDWRWQLARADSPWYPTARLLRQPRFGDWESVVREVGAALQAG